MFRSGEMMEGYSGSMGDGDVGGKCGEGGGGTK